MTGEQRDPRPSRYEFRVRGQLSETMLQAFDGLHAQMPSEGYTLLTGSLPDQAALHAVLAQIEALGLELLVVRKLPPTEDSS
jgi:hypothetical protein